MTERKDREGLRWTEIKFAGEWRARRIGVGPAHYFKGYGQRSACGILWRRESITPKTGRRCGRCQRFHHMVSREDATRS